MTAPSSGSLPRPLLLLGLVTASWLALFLTRILSPSDLLANDQQRVASYVMDAVQNGNWICQRDFREEVASKPPMFTWLAGAATAAMGRISRFTLCFPSEIATLLLAWLVLAVGSRTFGRGAGFWGAIACLLSPSGLKQVLLARTDPLFGATVFLTLMLGYRAWVRGAGWTAAWLAGAAATLTKGPLGLLFVGAGLLLAFLWERRRGEAVPFRGTQVPGVLLFLAVTAGWLVLAGLSHGGAVLERMIGQELIGHAVQATPGRYPGARLYVPPASFLASGLPWSLAACVGFWRVARHPSPETGTRGFERLLFGFFFAGLALLSLGSHQRRDLVIPLLPAAALLCGREMALRIHPGMARGFRARLLGIPAGMVALLVAQQILVTSRTDEVERTEGCQGFARRVEASAGKAFPLVHVNTPMAVQFFLDTFRPRVSAERAARLLEQPEGAFVAVRDDALAPEELRRLEGVAPHVVARWPESGRPFLRILGNRPRLEALPSFAMVSGDLYLRTRNLRLIEDHEGGFVLEPSGGEYEVTLTNEGPEPQRVRVAVGRRGNRRVSDVPLQSGGTWTTRGDAPAPEDPLDVRSGSGGRVLGASVFLLAVLAVLVLLAERTCGAVAAAETW